MWKIAFILLLAALAVLLAGLAYNPLMPQQALGAAPVAETAYAYAGVRG
jgi:hypothetical protein